MHQHVVMQYFHRLGQKKRLDHPNAIRKGNTAQSTNLTACGNFY
jgi:hypothetical protein